jgi:hypothetical protein
MLPNPMSARRAALVAAGPMVYGEAASAFGASGGRQRIQDAEAPMAYT